MNYQIYKERLFNGLLGNNHHDDFISVINDLNSQGYSKKEIYTLFLTFHKDIQIDLRTSSDDVYYDRLSDFMDGFINDRGFRILPDELMV